MKRILGFVFAALIGLFSMSCSQDKPPELLRFPYLQSAMADSLTVLWRSDVGQNSMVKFKPRSGSEWQEQKGTVKVTNTGWIENEVTLHSLISNTPYEYQVFTDGAQLGSTYSFNSPKIKTDSSFTFFAVGDIGEPVEEEGQPDILGKALAKSAGKYDLGLLLGDIIYPDGRSEVYDQNLFQYFNQVFPYVPVYPVLGNHDWHNPEDNYMQEWKLPNNEHYYSFDYGNVHFVALDSKNGEFHDFEKQVEWLEADLQIAQNQYDWLVVFLHHNGKSCTYKEDYPAVVSLYPLFEEYNVDLVLNGHAHTYERLNPMNGKGEVLKEYLNNTSEYDSPAGFLSITVGSGGKLRGVGTDPTPFIPDAENCRHPELMAKAVHDWAYLELSVSGKEIRAKALTTNTLEVVDEFVIRKK